MPYLLPDRVPLSVNNNNARVRFALGQIFFVQTTKVADIEGVQDTFLF
jgi:hypothetical protein